MHWETVSGNLRTVLQDLMGVSALEDFFLVGGTALALHLGHRISVDVDVFSCILMMPSRSLIPRPSGRSPGIR